jgi:hypothetical protein
VVLFGVADHEQTGEVAHRLAGLGDAEGGRDVQPEPEGGQLLHGDNATISGGVEEPWLDVQQAAEYFACL